MVHLIGTPVLSLFGLWLISYFCKEVFVHIIPAMASQTQIYISQAEEEENLCPASQLLGKMEASATSLPNHKAWPS